MTVYVFEIGWDYEGRNVVGVYSTIEAARAAVVSYDLENRAIDTLLVTELELDSAPIWPTQTSWIYERGDWKRSP